MAMTSIPATPGISFGSFALVQGLETSFLSELRQGLRDSPYLSQETRQGIDNMLRWNAPVRQIGDAFMMSLASDWFSRQAARFGADRAECAWHGAERLFEPLTPDETVPSAGSLDGRKDRYLRDFAGLDLMARAILEVRIPLEVRAGRFRDEFAFVDELVRPLGFFLRSRPDRGGSRSIFRFLSLSAFELGLQVFLGSAAPRFCLAPGGVRGGKLKKLRGSGYYAVRAPVDSHERGGMPAQPLDSIWHDIGRGASWAMSRASAERPSGSARTRQ